MSCCNADSKPGCLRAARPEPQLSSPLGNAERAGEAGGTGSERLPGREAHEVVSAGELGEKLRNAGVGLFFLEACQSAQAEASVSEALTSYDAQLQLQHPNVAQLLDRGFSQSSGHYLVVELVSLEKRG